MQSPVKISRDVADALAAHRPVVALESSVIAQGLPAPDILIAAAELLAAVGQAGAMPAMIGILDGDFRIGLDSGDIARLAEEDGVLKVSRRDIAYAVSTGQAGATTVSATMIGAAKAGIAVMATGGIGGVHRGTGHGMDISAETERAIAAAVAAAEAAGITGRAVTPYLLDRVAAATGGASIAVNRALLVANARLAAEIAVALANR